MSLKTIQILLSFLIQRMLFNEFDSQLGDESKLREIIKTFDRVSKLILRRNASKDPLKHKIREYLIITRYNDILKQVKKETETSDSDEELLASVTLKARKVLEQCLERLNSSFVIPLNVDQEINPPEIDSEHKINFEKEISDEEQDIDNNMSQTTEEFFRLASKILDSKFDGDPLQLACFFDQIELLEPMVLAANKPHMIKFICTRITGKA